MKTYTNARCVLALALAWLLGSGVVAAQTAASSSARPPAVSALIDQGAKAAVPERAGPASASSAMTPHFKFSGAPPVHHPHMAVDTPEAVGRMMLPSRPNGMHEPCAVNPHQAQC